MVESSPDEPLEAPAGAVPEHRERVAEATRRLQQQAAVAADDPRRWMEELRASVGELIDGLIMHIDETEREGGLYDEIMADKPRLAHAIDMLRREHVELLTGAVALMALAAVPTRAVDERQIRDDATALGTKVERHQRRGLNLLYEFYDVDLGIGE